MNFIIMRIAARCCLASAFTVFAASALFVNVCDFGTHAFFEQSLTRLNGRATQTVAGCERPVPLEFSYHEQTLLQALLDLKAADKLPVYIVHFTQRSAAETAQSLLSLTVCNQEEKQAIRQQLQRIQFNSPFGKLMKKLLLNGIGLHHAGLLPKYRLLVENLAQAGLLS